MDALEVMGLTVKPAHFALSNLFFIYILPLKLKQMIKLILGLGFSLALVIISSLTISLTIDTSRSIKKLSSVLSIKSVKAEIKPINDAEDFNCIDPPGEVGCLRWDGHKCVTGILCIL